MAHPSKDAVLDLIFERLDRPKASSWKRIRDRHPEVPASTFWRWVREARQMAVETPLFVILAERAEQRLTDGRAGLRRVANAMIDNAFGPGGDLTDPALLARGQKALIDSQQAELDELDVLFGSLPRFYEKLTEVVVELDKSNPELCGHVVRILHMANERMNNDRRETGRGR